MVSCSHARVEMKFEAHLSVREACIVVGVIRGEEDGTKRRGFSLCGGSMATYSDDR